jgi:hypothetical protein
MLKMIKAMMVVTILAISSVSQASLINVAYVEITHTTNGPLQVQEVVLWGAISGTDLALSSAGAVATATDFRSTSCGTSGDASCVLDSAIGSGGMSSIYHGASATSILTVTLNPIDEISWFEIFGRNYGGNKVDIYDVSFFNDNGAVLQYFTNLSAVQGSTTGRVYVSEPSAIAFLGLGLLMLALRRFKH